MKIYINNSEIVMATRKKEYSEIARNTDADAYGTNNNKAIQSDGSIVSTSVYTSYIWDVSNYIGKTLYITNKSTNGTGVSFATYKTWSVWVTSYKAADMLTIGGGDPLDKFAVVIPEGAKALVVTSTNKEIEASGEPQVFIYE